jgi:hypothetical protein
MRLRLKLFLIGAFLFVGAAYFVHRHETPRTAARTDSVHPNSQEVSRGSNSHPDSSPTTTQQLIAAANPEPVHPVQPARKYLPPVPTPEELEDAKRTNYLSTSGEGLILESSQIPGGGQFIDFQGRFQQITKTRDLPPVANTESETKTNTHNEEL